MSKYIKLNLGNDDVVVNLKRHHWAKQLSLKISRDGVISVTLPPRTPYKVGEVFVRSRMDWIKKQLLAHPPRKRPEPTKIDRKQARELVDQKLMQWGPQIALEWERVRIGNQRSRWGSASGRGTLSFNWRLIELPEELVNYVVVHELCHLKHLNHSGQFWALVERFLPNYKVLRNDLKQFDSSVSEG